MSFLDPNSDALDLTDEFETVSNVLFALNYRCDVVFRFNRGLVDLLVSINRINTASLVIRSNLVILFT